MLKEELRPYELVVISRPEILQKEAEELIRKKLEEFGGEVKLVDRWGQRKMTYEINKQRQGNYTTIYYEAESTIPKQLEKSMKHNESILRNLTVALKPSEYKAPSAEPEKGEEPAEKSEVEAES